MSLVFEIPLAQAYAWLSQRFLHDFSCDKQTLHNSLLVMQTNHAKLFDLTSHMIAQKC